MPYAMPDEVLSHWSKLLEGMQASSREFYASVEQAVADRQIPDSETSRVDWFEGGFYSAKREYLRVSRGRHNFDICGAPFGTGFFVSWWLVEERSLLGLVAVGLFFLLGIAGFVFLAKKIGILLGFLISLVALPFAFWLLVQIMNTLKEGWDDPLVAIPYFGKLYEFMFRPQTYYKTDTALMFQSAVHSAVLQVVDQMTTTKGLRALSESERKPIMKEYARS